ncbi:MAG: type II toxin-antitoxin system RelE/ParE family toxin [Desulfovibrionaceae bacterium]|jgi:plasmid stabilization system protein ParE|nr:type II toxin-antitoxin system RelE/ParE family toxin [Desulfovibrionaceae bacterium]
MMRYILSGAAVADLRGIARTTRKQWGSAQARHYRDRLEQGMARLAARQGPFKDMSALYPTMGMAHCEHHYIFGLLRENAPALIVAVFHERMDLMARLAERLGEPPGVTGIELKP